MISSRAPASAPRPLRSSEGPFVPRSLRAPSIAPARPLYPRYADSVPLAHAGTGVLQRVFDNVEQAPRVLKRAGGDAPSRWLSKDALEQEYLLLGGLHHPALLAVHEYGV